MSSDKLFNGQEGQFKSWLRRLTSKIRQKGVLFASALRGNGAFQGMKYDLDAASASVTVSAESLRKAGVAGMATPMAKSLGGMMQEDNLITPTKVTAGKDGEAKKEPEEPQEVRRSIQFLYNHVSEVIWGLIVESTTDEVIEDLLRNQVVEDDGLGAYKELTKIYSVGSKVNLLLRYRKFHTLKMTATWKQFDSEFIALTQYFDGIEKEKQVDMLRAMVYLEGLTEDYTDIRTRIYDEALSKMPSLSSIRQRIEGHTEVLELDRTREVSSTREKAFYGQEKKKEGYKKYADLSDEEKRETVFKCLNCNSRHKGGESYCKKPCKCCVALNKSGGGRGHVRYNCKFRNEYKELQRRKRQGRPPRNEPREKRDESANMAEGKDITFGYNLDLQSAFGFLAEEQAYVAAERQRKPIYIDGGATHHYFDKGCCNDKSIRNVRQIPGSLAGMAEGMEIKFKEIADVGEFRGVRMCDTHLRANLISVGKLCDDENCMLIHTPKGVYKKKLDEGVAHDGVLIAERNAGTNYLYSYKPEVALLANIKAKNPVEHIHGVTLHRSAKDLLRMYHKGELKCKLFDKYSRTQLEKFAREMKPCRTCAEARLKRQPKRSFPSEEAMEVKPGELFLIDIQYPIKPRGRSNEKGLVYCMDYASGMGICRPFQHKDNAMLLVRRHLQPIIARLPKSSKHVTVITARPDGEAALTSAEAREALGELGVRIEPGGTETQELYC